MGENQRAVDVHQAVQLWIAVGLQEIVEGPGRQVPQFVMEELLGNQATGKHGRRTGAIAFAVGDQREVNFEDFGSSRFQGLARVLPEADHRRSGVDALPGRATDSWRGAGTGIRVGVDEHAGHAEAFAGEGLGVGGQRRVGRRTHRGHAGDRHPGLQAPQVATGIGILGDHDVEDFQQVGHGAGKGHHHVHGRGQRPVAAHRDHPARRRVGAQAIVRRWPTTARPGFLGQAEGGKTGCGCRAGPIGGAGGEGRGEVGGVVGLSARP